MNDLKVFENENFGSVRTILIDDTPYFVGKDVAGILGYAKPLNALAMHIDEDDSLKQGLIDSMGRTQETIFINESGLYSLILSSKMPNAKKFKHWVTNDVLPTIRKHGAYLTPDKIEEVLLNPDTIIAIATQLKDERQKRERLESTIEEQKPKVVFADAVSASAQTILIGDLAKLIKQNGIDNMGQNRLFEWLRQNGYLIKRYGTDYNMPAQRSMEMGLFKVKETAVTHADGHITLNKTPKVTGKGQEYFINIFLNKEYSVNTR